MSNHVHIALQVDEISISTIMHHLNFCYAKKLNKRLKRIGHVFQDRFESIFVSTKSYLLELVRYIHLNPVRANMVRTADGYQWSSHQIYLGKQSCDWVTTNIVLEFLDLDQSSALKKYKNLMCHATKPDIEKLLMYNEPAPLEDFFDYPAINAAPSDLIINFDEILNFICEIFSIEAQELKTKSRDRRYCLARGIIVWLVTEFAVASMSFCAKYFKRDAAGLKRYLRRLESSEQSMKLFLSYKGRLISLKSSPAP